MNTFPDDMTRVIVITIRENGKVIINIPPSLPFGQGNPAAVR